ncbi:TFIIH complex subunit tfb5 [Pseudocyphellaria aurata]|nr:TFIIH complex subunit tfb5 [Pseudocyphellaria aurata]
MVKAVKGVLVECDPSIKAIILKIDQHKHDYIVEDLDDQTLVIKESQLASLKQRLDKELVNAQQIPDESDTESAKSLSDGQELFPLRLGGAGRGGKRRPK